MSEQAVVHGLLAQLEEWRAELERGADRVGWKIGLNIPEVQERLGIGEGVIGYLTSSTLVESGGEYAAGDAVRLMAEPEVALQIGRDVPVDADLDQAREAIAGLAPALELVDTGRPPAGVEAILAENVFHRAAVLGAPAPAFPAEGLEAVIRVNGEERESATAPDDFADVVELTARLLGVAGEQLREGDRIIAGSLTAQVPVGPGDVVAVELAGVGSVEARIAP